MTSTNHPEPDGFTSTLQTLGEQAYLALTELSQRLDQTLGAEVTTALTVVLGLVSLGLALSPFLSGLRRPVTRVMTPPASDEVKRDALGEEVVQMHPERLQQLYDLPVAAPAAAVTAPVPAHSPEMTHEPAASRAPAAEASAPTARHDMLLGLVADLSDELSQQQQAMQQLKKHSEQQQQQIQALLAQVKAQSSAFLLQGERLLRLESVIEPVPAAVPEASGADAGSVEVKRLNTFDQAIELARQGASADVLMAECGLSVSEARLVVLVHGEA